MKHSCYYQVLSLSLDPRRDAVKFGVAVVSSRGIEARFLPIEELQARIGDGTPPLDADLLSLWQEGFLKSASHKTRRSLIPGSSLKGVLRGYISGYSSVQIGEPQEQVCANPKDALEIAYERVLNPNPIP